MTAETVLRVGMAAGRHFIRGEHTHRVVIGKDTRLSGYMLEPALAAGFVSVGMHVIMVGPLPTPAVAMLTRSMRADLGVMISASHNAFEDNGIKLFGPDGYKLSDEVEAEIETRMDSDMTPSLADPGRLGRAQRPDDAQGRYSEYVKQTFPRGLQLDGHKIVVDCAHGAAYKVAPMVLWELGAEVIPMGVAPDGFNINRGCGSTSPETMQSQVVAHGAHLGIALDGDADRVMIADERGELINGDQILGLVAGHWSRSGRLGGGGVVATVMSNLGLENHLAGQGLSLERTQVGDRYVVEHMREHGFNLGGEQSGHIILSDYVTTGDGLVAALQVLAVLVETGKPASEVCRVFEPFPQVLKNVRFNGHPPLDSDVVRKAIAAGEATLGQCGRLLIRKSGTEPVIRVMAEGRTSPSSRAWSTTSLTPSLPRCREAGGAVKGRVLIVAGSDSGGGAGIQADIKAVTALGGFAMTAISALTAQNTRGVTAIHEVPDDFIAEQMRVVLSDIGADCLKTGMLHRPSVIETVCEVMADMAPQAPLVADPVMVAKGGARLLEPAAVDCLKRLLIPRATVLTPNLPEAESLTGMTVRDRDEMAAAGRALVDLGAQAVLVKGGHLEGATVIDLLVTAEEVTAFEDKRLQTRHTHGTGCTLASAIAAGLAQGLVVAAAVARARRYVLEAIRRAPGYGRGHGPLDHTHTVRPFDGT